MTRVGWCPGGRPVADMLTMYPGTTVARIFVGAGKPMPTWDGPVLAPAVAAGAVVHVSYKTNSTAEVLAWARAKPAGVLLLLTYAHEPEQGTAVGDPTVEQFHARWSELVPAFNGHPMRHEILLGPVYTRYWWQAHPGDLRWLVKAPVDYLGWDVYNNGTGYRTPDDLLSIPRQIADRTGLPYLVAELGAVRVPGDTGAGRQAWMRDMVAALRADGAWTACWFHKDEWDLTRADSGPEQATWRELTEQENTGMIVSGVRYVQGRNDYTDRDGTKYGIAIHNTSNDASAADEASYATRRTDGISAHFYVDDVQVVQSLDTRDRAGHAGSYEGNEHAIAVEITGTNDKTRQWWLANVAWDQLGAALAAVCRKYGIEPRRASVSEMQANPRVRAFYSHDDMRRAWGGTTHTDPGPNFPWDHLLATVKAHLTGEPVPPEEDEMTPAQFVEILADPKVASMMRAFPWQYAGGGIPTGMSMLGVVNELLTRSRAAGDDVDEAAIVAGVLAGLSPEKIAAAIPAELAQQVADVLHARLAS